MTGAGQSSRTLGIGIASLTARNTHEARDRLSRELDRLRKQNHHLRQMLLSQRTGEVTHYGYMLVHASQRGFIHLPPMLPPIMGLNWEQKYFTLTGSVLLQYKTEKDTAFFPEARYQLQEQLNVVWHGKEGQRSLWIISLDEADGSCMLRLACRTEKAAVDWCAALAAAGCKPRGFPDHIQLLPQQRFSPLSSYNQELRSSFEAEISEDSSSTQATSDRAAGEQQQPKDSNGMTRRKHAQPDGAAETTDSGDGPATDALERKASKLSSKSKPAKLHAKARGKKNPMTASTPMHHNLTSSLLSSDKLMYNKYSGLINLLMLVLFVSTVRLVVDNAAKYGILFNPFRVVNQFIFVAVNNPIITAGLVLLCCFFVMALVIEHLGFVLLRAELKAKEADIAKHGAPSLRTFPSAHLTESIMLCLNLANVNGSLILSVFSVMRRQGPVLPGLLLNCAAITTWMKLWSFAHCNWDFRRARRQGVLRDGERGGPGIAQSFEPTLQYPENLTARNLAYFMVAPTLLYQMEYPRSPSFRWTFLLRRVVECVVYVNLQIFLWDQYVEPAVKNSLRAVHEGNWMSVARRLLTISVPSVYSWICSFYLIFHLLCNIVAEILRFGDREFYRDWWNCTSFGEYWRLWNIPVHRWLARHVYSPIFAITGSRNTGMIAAFVVSAFFHELAISVPLRTFRGIALAGMLTQIPLVAVTDSLSKYMKNDVYGNWMFWTIFCFCGQPLIILQYYYQYARQHLPEYLGETGCQNAPGISIWPFEGPINSLASMFGLAGH